MNEGRQETMHHSSQLLRDFGSAYFDHVLAEYDSLSKGKITHPPKPIQEIIRCHAQNPDHLTWRDLYLLEKHVLTLQPPEVLKARAPVLESSYREIRGESAYDLYLQSRRLEKEATSFTGLRAKLGRLLDALHWVYSMVPQRERMRSDIVRQSGKWLMICFMLLLPFVVIFGLNGQTLIATVALVAFMGSLGGFLSLQRRIQNIPTERDPLLTMLELENGRFTVSLAPLTGAIFAVVLFLMFLGGLIEGTLFPTNLAFPDWKLGDPIVAASLVPFGKLLLWSFIAGFAERFVPDTLDNLVLKGKDATRATAKAGSNVSEMQDQKQRGTKGTKDLQHRKKKAA